jgi:hypothetical protein
MHRTIFVTEFDTRTKKATGAGTDSGFNSLDEVRQLMGEPILAGKRSLTYDGVFYSDYNLTGRKIELPKTV